MLASRPATRTLVLKPTSAVPARRPHKASVLLFIIEIMISFLQGKILNKGNGFVIVELNNIGYKVFVCQSLWSKLNLGQEVELYTHQYVKEDALNLYGFNNIEELDLFELFLSVSGIGPKSALGILGVAKAEDIKDSISQGDPSLLTKVSGIGRKTAERAVLELRGKISPLASSGRAAGIGSASGDEIDALMALGYSMGQARDALRAVDEKIKDSGERIKQALKRLG